MIFIVNERYAYTIEGYLESPWAQDLTGRIRLAYYDDLPLARQFPADTYVFIDLERLTAAQTELAKSVWQQLASAKSQLANGQLRLLNDPAAVLRRHALLQRMSELGRNDFRAVRGSDDFRGLRFPVFVRQENGHTGCSALLRTWPDVERALSEFAERFQSSRHDLLVVEFCDTSDGTGLYRKYSAFKVGDAIVPRFLSFSRRWVVKSESPVYTEETIRAEDEYTHDNPHEAWVREVFEIARIDFGRIDYGVYQGRPQVWEINTNPQWTAMPSRLKRPGAETPEWIEKLRTPLKERFHTRFREALKAIDGDPADGKRVRVSLDPAWAFGGPTRWVGW